MSTAQYNLLPQTLLKVQGTTSQSLSDSIKWNPSSLDAALSDWKTYMISVGFQAIQEFAFAVLLYVAVVTGIETFPTPFSYGAISALALYVALSSAQGKIFLTVMSIGGDVLVTCYQLKHKTAAKIGLLLVTSIARISLLLLAGLAACEWIIRRYSQAQIDDVAKIYLLKPTSEWSDWTTFGYVFLCSFIFNSLLYDFYTKINISNYLYARDETNTKFDFNSDATVNANRISKPLVIAIFYYLSILIFSKDIGDPIQIGVYITLQWATRTYHGTWPVIVGSFLGSIVAGAAVIVQMYRFRRNSSSHNGKG